MATRYQGGASASPAFPPLDVLLSALPSLPRPVLSRLVARAIDRLDEMDGDPDLEDDDPPGTDEPDQPAFTGHAFEGTDGRRYVVPDNMHHPRTGF